MNVHKHTEILGLGEEVSHKLLVLAIEYNIVVGQAKRRTPRLLQRYSTYVYVNKNAFTKEGWIAMEAKLRKAFGNPVYSGVYIIGFLCKDSLYKSLDSVFTKVQDIFA